MQKLVLALIALCLTNTAFSSEYSAKIFNNSDNNDMVVYYKICEGLFGQWGGTDCYPTQEVTISSSKNSSKKHVNYLNIPIPAAKTLGNGVWLYVTKVLAQNSGKTVAEATFDNFQCGASSAVILNDMHSPYVLCQLAFTS